MQDVRWVLSKMRRRQICEQEFVLVYFNCVAEAQRLFAGNFIAVQIGAVAATKIQQNILIAAKDNLSMLPRHTTVFNDNIAIVVPPKQQPRPNLNTRSYAAVFQLFNDRSWLLVAHETLHLIQWDRPLVAQNDVIPESSHHTAAAATIR